MSSTGWRSCTWVCHALMVLCALPLITGGTLVFAVVSGANPGSESGEEAAAIPPEQLDALVAPIALYPDPLLAQTLAASTYPLEIIQLQQWLARNPGLKGQALTDAVMKQRWEPSIQAMASVPDVVKRLSDDIQWTTDLGNAFLAQQGDVMSAVQRMRKKASDKGTLKTTQQLTVETRVVESKSVIVIEQADPQVVYVPSYNPVVVYGDPVYPYPPIYYPPPYYYPGGLALAFGAGVAIGAAWSGGWGWGCGWGHGDINVNQNNNFNRNANIGNGNVGGGNRWQHRPEHRGGTPYRDRTTAQRFGGTRRGESLAGRQATARRDLARQGGNLPSNRRDNRDGVRDRGAGVPGGNRTGAGRSDRIGGQELSRGGSGNRNVFGGGGGGYNGRDARASSNRGASSLGARGARGGGGRRGGGGGRRR